LEREVPAAIKPAGCRGNLKVLPVSAKVSRNDILEPGEPRPALTGKFLLTAPQYSDTLNSNEPERPQEALAGMRASSFFLPVTLKGGLLTVRSVQTVSASL